MCRIACSATSSSENPWTVDLKIYRTAELPPELFDWAFQLVKSNLYHLYVAASDTGWTDRRKRKEMTEGSGFYIIAFLRPDKDGHSTPSTESSSTPKPPPPSTSTSAIPPSSTATSSSSPPSDSSEIPPPPTFAKDETGKITQPVGFIYFQFLMEESYDNHPDEPDDEAPVVYCLELQLTPPTRSHGLGTHLMHLLETLGSHFGMRKSMLTVFKSNVGAMKFYKKLGYDLDGISPGRAMNELKASRYSYEILFKELK
ncbi:hypothetical protein HDV05_003412 [Chytridiales sp. JEL 0842]|nr:hypothetical protein HDV05_003412 [Chytridiales sp. JEL 0842]